jgi:hypothetical protein
MDEAEDLGDKITEGGKKFFKEAVNVLDDASDKLAVVFKKIF